MKNNYKNYMLRLFLLFLIFCTTLPVFAQTLSGGVEYSIEDARIELKNNIPTVDFLLTTKNYTDTNYIENYSALLKGATKFNDRTLAIFSDKTYAINYNNDKKHVWYYDANGNLINVEIKSSTIYPYKTYKFNPDGELVNMTMRVSEDETFIFNPFGKLLGHWIKQNCYDENGNVIMTRKIFK